LEIGRKWERAFSDEWIFLFSSKFGYDYFLMLSSKQGGKKLYASLSPLADMRLIDSMDLLGEGYSWRRCWQNIDLSPHPKDHLLKIMVLVSLHVR
jgi:hypothetical protein